MIPFLVWIWKKALSLVGSVAATLSFWVDAVALILFRWVEPIRTALSSWSLGLRDAVDAAGSSLYDFVWQTGNTGFVLTVILTAVLLLQFLVRGIFFLVRAIRRRIHDIRRGIAAEWSFTFRSLFHRDFYAGLFLKADLSWSRLVARILLRLGEILKDYPWFDVEYCRHLTWEQARRLERRTEPFRRFFMSVFLRLTPGRKEESSSRLMDEGRIPETDATLPEAVRTVLSGQEIPGDGFTDPEWDNALETVANRWEKGLVSGLLVKGGNGSGKTALLGRARERFGSERCLGFEPLAERQPLEDFLDTILSSRISEIAEWERKIVLVDDLESLLLRKIGGFDRLNQFCQAVERTKECFLWIVVCNPVFFDFAVQFIPLRQIFHRITELANPSPAELARWCVANYFTRIGFSVRVRPDKTLAKAADKKIRHKEISETERDSWLMEQYFRRLLDHGGLNFPFIRFSLVRSISRGIHGGLVLSMPEFLEIPLLKDLSLDDHFILSSLLLHGRMNKEEILAVLPGLTVGRVSIALSLFYENNLVTKVDGRFKVNPVVYLPLVRFYRQKKMVG